MEYPRPPTTAWSPSCTVCAHERQVQWLIEQLAGASSPLTSAEMLEMMAAVAPQVKHCWRTFNFAHEEGVMAAALVYSRSKSRPLGAGVFMPHVRGNSVSGLQKKRVCDGIWR